MLQTYMLYHLWTV